MSTVVSDRATARLAWAREVLGDATLTLQPASSDASFRSYWRIERPGGSVIVMDSPPALEDPRPWLEIGARLRHAGLNTPQVLAQDLGAGFLLISDLGRRPYLPELREDSVDALYADALDALLQMQTRVDARDLPAYDEAFLQREMHLLPEWFLGRHLGRAPDAGETEILRSGFGAIADSALEQPRCFVHRDFHSRNLMIVPDHNPGIIDFQGAVAGPLAYDLASLLRDCYIAWGDARVEAWAEGYRLRLRTAGLLDESIDAARFRRWFDLIGLQRHVKVLGLFCRLYYRDGKAGYLADLPRVLGYVLGVAGRYPELHAFGNLLRRAVGDRDIAQAAA